MLTQFAAEAPSRSQSHFDQVARRYAALYEGRAPTAIGFRLRRQRVVEQLKPGCQKVLDVGCGSGVFVQDIVDRGAEYWGIDLSPNMVQEGVRVFPAAKNAHFAVGSGASIPFADGSFDTVICVGVLDRLPDAQPIVAEMLRVLSPGGTLVISVSNRTSPYFLWKDLVLDPLFSLVRTLRGSRSRESVPAGAKHRSYSASSIGRMVSAAGGSVSKASYTCFIPVLPPMDRLVPGLTSVAIEQLEPLRHTPFGSFGTMVVTTATKA